MSYEELVKEIKEYGVSSVANEDFNSSELPIELVHAEGGHSGDGEYAERVFEHDNNGEKIYVKITGFYSSYDGTDWDSDLKQVSPLKKTITVYE